MEEYIRADFATQKSLNTYNKLYGTQLSGDFEGNLDIKMPNYTIRIYASGTIINVMPDDTTKSCKAFTPEFINEVKNLIEKIERRDEDLEPAVDPKVCKMCGWRGNSVLYNGGRCDSCM